ncbi:hypothetical protein N7451_006868 [Penicillium sp. IBT 35674x]|nr:hypothetical protein N7451_006868 [Penicillium sp. IBT 35674x]
MRNYDFKVRIDLGHADGSGENRRLRGPERLLANDRSPFAMTVTNSGFLDSGPYLAPSSPN